jgi:hypothetical protein
MHGPGDLQHDDRGLLPDRDGDIRVDTARSREVYLEWLQRTRPASRHSPDGTRRPYWLLRPLKPSREAYKFGRPGF